ncbi:uncharacterized protein Schip1 isoform X3 [Periplaneta americana]|uniref:uncharacterized protein Schip1 isoform X3 n=1 Tax=Periplaneta americana TaxID=6978 RepID=UPI0037E7645C
MRLKEAHGPVDVPGSRPHNHNVGQRDRNRNESAPRDKLPDSAVIHCSTQWASNYVTSPNTTICTTPTTAEDNGSNLNNNITASLQHHSSYSTSSEFLSESSPDDSLGDFEDGQQSSSSLDVSPQGDEYRCFSHEELSDSDSLSDDGNCRGSRGRGIVNPNYPGFQHLAHELHASDEDSEDEDDDDDNNNSVNHLGSAGSKAFYDKPKFNIPADAADAKDLNVVVSSMAALALAGDAYLSGAKEDLLAADSEGEEKFSKEEREKEEVPRKKEKMDINLSVKEEVPGVRRRDAAHREHVLANRRSVPGAARDKKRSSAEILGGFDVYNIETAMPKIDLDAIESHLRAAREEERRRRNDREEIRRRLAMGSDTDEYYGGERPGRKPSLQARLQSESVSLPGMNLQICFMNETVSDTESPSSDTETAPSPIKTEPVVPRSSTLPVKSLQLTPPPVASRPSTSLLTLPLRREPEPPQPVTEADFFARQARLQAEARMALAQAKEMAHMQMEVERQRQKKSPITEMVRSSLEKVGIPFPEDRRRVSRQILTEMNVAQLQVIVNDLHTQIEILNEGLVKFLMDRDDLHMEQDSMLVDIEDLTRYLGAKEQTVKEQKDLNQSNNNHLLPPTKPKITRIASLVKK